MKPNFSRKSQTNKILEANVQSKHQTIQQQFPDLGQSLIGDRQFIAFNSNCSNINPLIINKSISENMSLMGTSEKVYFTNSSKLIKEQIKRDMKLKQEENGFKPKSKIQRESQKTNNYNKAKSQIPIKKQENSQFIEEDDNQFLDINNVGKWQKSNKSTVISEQMKKIQTQYENRLTETKWVKNPSKKAQREKNQSQSDPSISNINSRIVEKVSLPLNSSSILKESKTDHMIQNSSKNQKFTLLKQSILQQDCPKLGNDQPLNEQQNLQELQNQQEQDQKQQQQEQEQQNQRQGQDQCQTSEQSESQEQQEEQEQLQNQGQQEQLQNQEQQEQEQEQEQEQQGQQEQGQQGQQEQGQKQKQSEDSQEGDQGQNEDQEVKEQQEQEQDNHSQRQIYQKPVQNARKWITKANNNQSSKPVKQNASISAKMSDQSLQNTQQQQTQNDSEKQIQLSARIKGEQWSQLQTIIYRIHKLIQ